MSELNPSDHDLLVTTHRDVEYIKDTVQRFPDSYVSKAEFTPVQKIVYGMVGGILAAVLLAIMAYVVPAVSR